MLPPWHLLPARAYGAPVSEAVGTLRTRQQERTQLEISESAVDLFVAKGFSSTTIEEIARAARVSQRTVHRHFPAKADCVGPVLDAGWRELLDIFAERPGTEPVTESLVAALEAVFNSRQGKRNRRFLRNLPDLPALEPVWLRTAHRSEEALQPLLAVRLGLSPQDPRLRFAAACVTAAARIGFESWARNSRRSVVETTREFLQTIDEALLRPSTPTTTPEPSGSSLRRH
jgi:AcrR family transcriptional regulator